MTHLSKITLFKRNFFNTAVADVLRAVDGGSLVGAFVLSFCLIDYMTWIEYGESKFGFTKWISYRLLPLNICYQGKEEELYSVRNGLVHTYGPSRDILRLKFMGYSLLKFHPEVHLQKINSPVIQICLYSFVTEIIYASYLTFEDLATSASSLQMMQRLSLQINISGSVPPLCFNDMHRALAPLDSTENVSLFDIRKSYQQTMAN